MATAFEVALENFARWAESTNPDFGRQVRAVIGAQYVSQLAGLGVAIDQGSASEIGASVPQRTANALGDLVETVKGAFINSASAYYDAKRRIEDLKLQAQGSPLTQFVNAATPAPASWILWGGLGLAAILLLRPRGR